MSNLKAEVVVEFAGEERLFRLTVPGVLELEDKADAPFAVIAGRLAAGTYKIDDVLHTIRLGLIGGGLSPADTAKLMRGYVYPERPLAEAWALARVIVSAALLGFEKEPLGEGKAEAAGSPSA